jgi:hypothetical protein
MQRVNVLLNHLTAAPACERLSAASVAAAAAAGSSAGKLSGHVAIITGSGNGIGASESVGVG